MKRLILLPLVGLLSFPAYADPALTSQINAVHAAELEQQRARDAEEAKWRAETERRQADEAARQERAERARVAAAKARADELKSDKQRDQVYEDKLRDLEIQQRAIALQKEQKRANREDDFIDEELHMHKAQADVVQSNADANRNVSEGTKSLLTDTGKAEVKESSRWFKW